MSLHTGAYAGLRASGKKADLALVVCDTDAVVGGTFTQNVMCAAPVLYCQDVLSRYAGGLVLTQSEGRLWSQEGLVGKL